MTNDKPDKTKIFNALIQDMVDLDLIKRFTTEKQSGVIMTGKGFQYLTILNFMKEKGDLIENLAVASDSVS